MPSATDKNIRSSDELYMRLALSLARKGGNRVSPNPQVGAVIVKNGKILGRGYHKYFGGPHAEVYAVRNARRSVTGATIYVNLEPCNIYGKTPPCTDLLIRAGLREVVIGATDPNPRVSGKGIRQLRKAGIQVRTGILKEECEQINEAFTKFILKKIPFVTLKIAQTLDGRIADRDGSSRWISEKASRVIVHNFRAVHDAVLVGAGTVKTDDPRLTARISGAHNPLRIVLDGRFSSPVNAKVYRNQSSARTLLLTDIRFLRRSGAKRKTLENRGVLIYPFTTAKPGIIPVGDILRFLGSLGIKSLLVEGGSNIFSRFLESGVADKMYYFISGKILGSGKDAFVLSAPKTLERAVRLERMKAVTSGNDILITGYFK